MTDKHDPPQQPHGKRLNKLKLLPMSKAATPLHLSTLFLENQSSRLDDLRVIAYFRPFISLCQGFCRVIVRLESAPTLLPPPKTRNNPTLSLLNCPSDFYDPAEPLLPLIESIYDPYSSPDNPYEIPDYPYDPILRIQTQTDIDPPYMVDFRPLFDHPVTGTRLPPQVQYSESLGEEIIPFLTRTLFLGEFDGAGSNNTVMRTVLGPQKDSEYDPYVLSYCPFYVVQEDWDSAEKDTMIRLLPILRPNLEERYFEAPSYVPERFLRVGHQSKQDPYKDMTEEAIKEKKLSESRDREKAFARAATQIPVIDRSRVFMALWVSRASQTDRRTSGWRKAMRKGRAKFLFRVLTADDHTKIDPNADTDTNAQENSNPTTRHKPPYRERLLPVENIREESLKSQAADLASGLFRDESPEALESDLARRIFERQVLWEKRERRRKRRYTRTASRTSSTRDSWGLLDDPEITEPGQIEGRSVRVASLTNPVDSSFAPMSRTDEVNRLLYELLFNPIPAATYRNDRSGDPRKYAFTPSALPRPGPEDFDQGLIGFVEMPPQVAEYFKNFDLSCIHTGRRLTAKQVQRRVDPDFRGRPGRPADTHAMVSPSGLVRIFPSAKHLNFLTPIEVDFMSSGLSIRSSPMDLTFTVSLNLQKPAKLDGGRVFGATTLRKHEVAEQRFPAGRYFLSETPLLTITPDPTPEQPERQKKFLTFCFCPTPEQLLIPIEDWEPAIPDSFPSVSED